MRYWFPRKKRWGSRAAWGCCWCCRSFL